MRYLLRLGRAILPEPCAGGCVLMLGSAGKRRMRHAAAPMGPRSLFCRSALALYGGMLFANTAPNAHRYCIATTVLRVRADDAGARQKGQET
jgi:hypothetical protein